MKKTNVILYTTGGYGHFINWCCEYFSGNLDSDQIPLNDLGNCHNFKKTVLLTVHPQLKNYTESTKEDSFIQIHECSFAPITNTNNLTTYADFVDDFAKNLEYLSNNYQKSICLLSTNRSKWWVSNNKIYKRRIEDTVGENLQAAIDFFKSYSVPDNMVKELMSYGIDCLKHQINNQPGISKNFLKWGHNSIDEFDIWELRELASQYYYDRVVSRILQENSIEYLRSKFPTIYFIEIDNLRDNFIGTIESILKHFDLPITNWEKISEIHETWLSKQIHINKDKQISDIVNALTNKQDLNWSEWNLTFIDEAVIQHKLLDNNISIKCWQLNEFPTNTKDFLPLLERT